MVVMSDSNYNRTVCLSSNLTNISKLWGVEPMEMFFFRAISLILMNVLCLQEIAMFFIIFKLDLGGGGD